MESADDEDEYYDGTGAENNNYDRDGTVNGDGGGDSNTGALGGSTERIRFLHLSAQTEPLGAMAKAKASSSTASRKKTKLVKSKIKIAWKRKAAQKLVKNSSKTARGEIGGLLRVQQPQPLGSLCRIR